MKRESTRDINLERLNQKDNTHLLATSHTFASHSYSVFLLLVFLQLLCIHLKTRNQLKKRKSPCSCLVASAGQSSFSATQSVARLPRVTLAEKVGVHTDTRKQKQSSSTCISPLVSEQNEKKKSYRPPKEFACVSFFLRLCHSDEN